jgi:uncharacterized membrane protein YkvA (DUF1232 family)
MRDRLKGWGRHLRNDTYALYFAYRDPRVPWYAKVLAAFVVAHTLSPIDLIPDFIPILGYLDDLIVTPLGLALAFKLIPAEVMAEARMKAANDLAVEDKRLRRAGIFVVISIWLGGLLLLAFILIKYL